MKLKPVIASLLALGLVSIAGPGFAKAVKSVDHKVANAEAVVDQNSAKTSVAQANWFDRITLGGRATVVGIWGSDDFPGAFTDIGHSSDFYVNNVNFTTKIRLSDWFKATVDVVYDGQPKYMPYLTFDQHHKPYPIFVGAFDREIDNKLYVSEAYITLSNFAKTPFYAVFGKKALPFGEYDDMFVPFQIMPLTQVLAEVNEPAVVGGVATDFGLYASAFAFRGKTQPLPDEDDLVAGSIRNFGAKVGFRDDLGQFGLNNTKYNVNVSWIYNIIDGTYWDTGYYPIANQDPVHYPFQRDPVGGLSVHADASYNHFGFVANFVGALQDVIGDYYYQANDSQVNHGRDSSRLWAADITAKYDFMSGHRDSNVSLSYQFTGNGQFLIDINPFFQDAVTFPQNRWLASYSVNLVKHVDAKFAYVHNNSYEYESHEAYNDGDYDHHDHTRSSNVALAGLAVTF